MDMDGIAEQLLHGLRPKSRWRAVDHRLEIADLMGQTQLAFPGRGLHLGRQAIAAPDFGCMVCHDFPDHIFTAIIADHMQDRMQSTKHPLVPVATIPVSYTHLTL